MRAYLLAPMTSALTSATRGLAQVDLPYRGGW